jgi:hypothetical protein
MAPQSTGVTLHIRDGKLHLPDTEPVALPAETWLHFEIQAGVGQKDNGTWNLTVTLPDNKKVEFENLKYQSKDFKKLEWLGFISNNTHKTSFYVDNIKLNITP